MRDLKIDKEFRDMLPPLKPSEYKSLETSIVSGGCVNPIVIWNDTIVDGHNRYNICTENGVKFDVKEIEFETRDDAIEWILSHGLSSGREYTPMARSIIRGQLYTHRKKMHGGDRKSRGKNYPLKSQPHPSAEAIGEEFGVSESTIRKDAQFIDCLEKCQSIDPDIKKRVLSHGGPKKKHILEAAKVLDQDEEKAKQILSPKSEPAKDPEIKQHYTDEITAILKEGKKLNQCIGILEKARRDVYSIIKGNPVADHFGGQQFDGAIRNAKETIKAAIPYAPCPKCKGEGCRSCFSRKVVTKQSYIWLTSQKGTNDE